MAGITKGHHTGFTVSSLERSIAFYRDLLGFELVFQWNPQAPYLRRTGRLSRGRHACARSCGCRARKRFWSFWSTAISRGRPVDMANGNIGNGHIAFTVDDLETFHTRACIGRA